MAHDLSRWDAHALHLVQDQGWREMPEAACMAILAAAHIPYSLLSLTLLDLIALAGHRRTYPRHSPGKRTITDERASPHFSLSAKDGPGPCCESA